MTVFSFSLFGLVTVFSVSLSTQNYKVLFFFLTSITGLAPVLMEKQMTPWATEPFTLPRSGGSPGLQRLSIVHSLLHHFHHPGVDLKILTGPQIPLTKAFLTSDHYLCSPSWDSHQLSGPDPLHSPSQLDCNSQYALCMPITEIGNESRVVRS